MPSWGDVLNKLNSAPNPMDEMRRNLASACGVAVEQIGVKATTEEGLGFTGSGEGMAAHAVCLIEKESKQ